MNTMINVTVGNNTSRQTVIVPSSKTVREVFDEAGISYEGTMVSIDGCPLNLGDLSKTLEQLNISDKCYIIATTKTNNAR